MGSLINRTLPNLAQGVSRQFVENRLETQNEEMINCIPDLARGIFRRNPLQSLENSVLLNSNGVELIPNEYYTYSYERGTNKEELYTILLGNKEWYIFDFRGNLVSDFLDVHNSGNNLEYLNCIDDNGILQSPNEVFELMTVGDFTFILNKLITARMEDKQDGELNSHKKTAVYWIKQTGLIATSSNPSSGTVTFEGHKFNLRLNDTLGGAQANTTIKTSDLVAEQIKIAMNGNVDSNGNVIKTDGPYYKNGFKWDIQRFVIGAGSGTEYRYYILQVTWKNAILKTFKFDTEAEAEALTTFKIGDYTYNKLNKASSITINGVLTIGYKIERVLLIEENATAGNWYRVGSIIFNKLTNESDNFEWFDSFGNTASFGFKGEVSKIEDLPENVPTSLNNLLVRIGKGEEESYWLEWDGSRWNESLEDGLYNTIDKFTMPHVFIRGDNGKFTFGHYGKFDGITDENNVFNETENSNWFDRKVGDKDTSPVPSFIDKKINNMFSHNNRLGLLTESNVVLSETAEYGNFFPTTMRTIPDTDPIDVAVATKEVTGLLRALSINSNLVLFSKSSQFTLFGNGGVLSPNNAEIVQLSNYGYNDLAKAIEYKDNIIFTSQTGNGSNLLSFKVNNVVSGNSIIADTLNNHIPNYINNNITKIVSHTNLNHIFIFSKDVPNELVVLNLDYVSGQIRQLAFHKWVFDIDILDINVIDNFLYITSKDIDKLYMNKIDLTVSKDIKEVVYKDIYNQGILENNYNSEIEFSKFYIKDEKSNGNKRGRLQIRTLLYTITQNSYYKTFITNLSVLKKRNFDTFVLDKNNKWNDDGTWCDLQNSDLTKNCSSGDTNTVWHDLNNFNFREYTNDEKVTVMGNNEQIQIRFTNNYDEPTKGFELATINYEALFNNRSRRI